MITGFVNPDLEAVISKRIGQDELAYGGGYLSFMQMVSPDIGANISAGNPWLLRRAKG
jgi:hypothetical protein